MNSKNKIREKYKSIRDSIPSLRREAAAKRIAARLFDLPEWKRAGMIGFYLSKGAEVDTSNILKKALSARKRVAAPRVVNHRKIEFRRIRSLRDCKVGAFGVREPSSRCPIVSPKELDLILVPGIAFDRQGYRLGYGKGYYDRFLKQAARAFKAGLAYEKTLAPLLPRDRRDIPVDCVVTEARTVLARRRV